MYNLTLVYVKAIYISSLLNCNMCHNNIELNSFCYSVPRLLVGNVYAKYLKSSINQDTSIMSMDASYHDKIRETKMKQLLANDCISFYYYV